jgi:hypothetical protein
MEDDAHIQSGRHGRLRLSSERIEKPSHRCEDRCNIQSKDGQNEKEQDKEAN